MTGKATISTSTATADATEQPRNYSEKPLEFYVSRRQAEILRLYPCKVVVSEHLVSDQHAARTGGHSNRNA